MTDPMTPERLAEIEQRFASGRVVNVVTQRALLAEVRRLQATVERVRELHQDEGQSQGYFPDDRGYGERDHCCGTCGSHGEYGVEWPCPTIAALDGDAMKPPISDELVDRWDREGDAYRELYRESARAVLLEALQPPPAATPTEPIEPLPEYMHQSLPIASLRRAIELLELAKSTDKPQDRLELLRRADAQTMYARDTAKSAMARWRHWNKQACTLGFLATYGPPPDPPVLDGPKGDAMTLAAPFPYIRGESSAEAEAEK